MICNKKLEHESEWVYCQGEGVASRGEGEGNGVKYDQDTLYGYMQLSTNKLKKTVKITWS